MAFDYVRAPLMELSSCLTSACLEELAVRSLVPEMLQHIPVEEPERRQVLQRACQHLMFRVLQQAIWKNESALGLDVPALKTKHQVKSITHLVLKPDVYIRKPDWCWLMDICVYFEGENYISLLCAAAALLTGLLCRAQDA